MVVQSIQNELHSILAFNPIFELINKMRYTPHTHAHAAVIKHDVNHLLIKKQWERNGSTKTVKMFSH